MKKLSFLLFLTLQMGMAQAQEKLVALSFDDAPNTTTTVHMLDVLKKHQVKASFFVIEKNITQESDKVMISRIKAKFCANSSQRLKTFGLSWH